jgi:hypothetical protein
LWTLGGNRFDGIVYWDRRWRWSEAIYWRRPEVRTRDEGRGFLGTLESREGPMTASGKPHGQWTIVSHSDWRSTLCWFWYGEQVSEGEWRRRTGG